MLLPQETNFPTSPPGFGYALITNTGSMINMGFFLSDGTGFSLSEPINQANQFPVYASLYNNTGLVLGQISLAGGAIAAVPGTSLTWIKPKQATALYPAGFNTTLGVEGSPWTNAPSALAGLFPTCLLYTSRCV